MEKLKVLKKTCILHLFLICLSNTQPLAQEDDDKMTFKLLLLSYRDHSDPFHSTSFT